MVAGKIGPSAQSNQIPMMLYQKALAGVFVGAGYERLMSRFIDHCLQNFTLLLYYYILQPPKNTETRSIGVLG